MGCTACTEPQCPYKGALYPYFYDNRNVFLYQTHNIFLLIGCVHKKSVLGILFHCRLLCMFVCKCVLYCIVLCCTVLLLPGVNPIAVTNISKLRKAIVSFVMSVRLSVYNNSAPTGWIFVKFDILRIFENISTKFKFHKNLTRIAGTLHADQYIYIA